MKVLVLEEMDDMCEIYGMYLRHKGIECNAAQGNDISSFMKAAPAYGALIIDVHTIEERGFPYTRMMDLILASGYQGRVMCTTTQSPSAFPSYPGVELYLKPEGPTQILHNLTN